MPMTRLQITPERNPGRTKRKPQQAPFRGSFVRQLERLELPTALGDGRARRRRRRRGDDGVVDGWCEERGSGAAGSARGTCAGVNGLDGIGGAFGAIGEGAIGGGAAASATGRVTAAGESCPATTPSSSSSLTLPPRKSLSMCFTSTGTALSLPPKKKDIYRPYSLQPTSEIRTSAEEDLSAAQAILDLSASPAAPTHSVFIHTLSPPPPPPPTAQPQATPAVTAVPQIQPTQLPQPPSAQPIPVSVLVPVPASQTNQLRQQEQTPPQPQSPATAEANASNCAGPNRDR